MLITFYHCDRLPEGRIASDRVDLAHSFGEFSPWLPRPSMLEQDIMVMRMCGEFYIFMYIMVDRKQCAGEDLGR